MESSVQSASESPSAARGEEFLLGKRIVFHPELLNSDFHDFRKTDGGFFPLPGAVAAGRIHIRLKRTADQTARRCDAVEFSDGDRLEHRIADGGCLHRPAITVHPVASAVY